MIKKAILGNLFDYIEKYKIESIMNAANAIGPMGSGIAGAIRKYGGIEIQDDAFKVCELHKPKAGDVYITTSGQLEKLGVKHIIHAVTMQNPGGFTSLKLVNSAFLASLSTAKKMGLKSIACTALGTGVGNLDPKLVAESMYEVSLLIKGIDIYVIDINNVFIKHIEHLLME